MPQKVEIDAMLRSISAQRSTNVMPVADRQKNVGGKAEEDEHRRERHQRRKDSRVSARPAYRVGGSPAAGGTPSGGRGQLCHRFPPKIAATLAGDRLCIGHECVFADAFANELFGYATLGH